jgi:hypothetical protein
MTHGRLHPPALRLAAASPAQNREEPSASSSANAPVPADVTPTETNRVQRVPTPVA